MSEKLAPPLSSVAILLTNLISPTREPVPVMEEPDLPALRRAAMAKIFNDAARAVAEGRTGSWMGSL